MQPSFALSCLVSTFFLLLLVLFAISANALPLYEWEPYLLLLPYFCLSSCLPHSEFMPEIACAIVRWSYFSLEYEHDTSSLLPSSFFLLPLYFWYPFLGYPFRCLALEQSVVFEPRPACCQRLIPGDASALRGFFFLLPFSISLRCWPPMTLCPLPLWLRERELAGPDVETFPLRSLALQLPAPVFVKVPIRPCPLAYQLLQRTSAG